MHPFFFFFFLPRWVHEPGPEILADSGHVPIVLGSNTRCIVAVEVGSVHEGDIENWVDWKIIVSVNRIEQAFEVCHDCSLSSLVNSNCVILTHQMEKGAKSAIRRDHQMMGLS